MLVSFELLIILLPITDVNDSPYMVFEFMEHGDLAGLLRKNDPSLRRNRDKPCLKDVSASFRSVVIYSDNVKSIVNVDF